MNGVSIIIPARNAENTLGECLQAATTLNWSGGLEVIVVNDGSRDRTAEIASSFSGVKVIDITHQGVAQATNIGVKAAHYDIVVLVDADAVLEKEWLHKIICSFDDSTVAAASGYMVTASRSVLGKLMGYDLELRLDRVPLDTDRLYTVNAVCRRDVLLEAGLFDRDLHAGQDVDLSRRLKATGYRLILRKDVRCWLYWKDNLRDYLWQQYNYAYYRMELTRRFRKPHDQVTGLGMILQVPFTMLVLLLVILGSLASPWALLALLLLPITHLPETTVLLFRKKDVSILLLPLLFTVRNLCWIGAAISWGAGYITRLRFIRPGATHPLTDRTEGLSKESMPENGLVTGSQK